MRSAFIVVILRSLRSTKTATSLEVEFVVKVIVKVVVKVISKLSNLILNEFYIYLNITFSEFMNFINCEFIIIIAYFIIFLRIMCDYSSTRILFIIFIN